MRNPNRDPPLRVLLPAAAPRGRTPNPITPMPFAFLSWTPADLINHVWQSSVVALALLLLAALCLRLPARTRLTLGWMALAKFVLPFGFFAGFVTLLGGDPERWLVSRVFTAPIEMPARFAAGPAANPGEPLPSGSLLPPVTSPTGEFGASGTSKPPLLGSLSSRLLHAPSLPAIAAALWLTGFATLYGGWLIAGFRLRRHVLDGATPVSPAMEQRLTEAAAKAGLDALPRRLEVRAEHSPGLLGVFSPILLIPRGLEEKLTPAELESVPLHELTHLQRRDPFWLAVHITAVSALWFNPISWLLSRWIRLETEKACDERVLELTGRPDIYAQGILKVVRHTLGLPEPRLLSVITPPIVSRVKNILGHGQHPHRRWQTSFALGTGATVLALAGHAGTLAIAASVPNEPASVPVAARADAAGRESQAPTVSGAPFTQRDSQIGHYSFTPAAGTTTGPATLLAQTITPAAATTPPTTPALSLSLVSPAATVAQRDTLSVDYPEEEIRGILRNVADLFQINIIIPETLQGRTSVKLRDVTWRQIFQSVLDPVGHAYQEEGNIVRILRKPPVTPPAAPAPGTSLVPPAVIPAVAATPGLDPQSLSLLWQNLTQAQALLVAERERLGANDPAVRARQETVLALARRYAEVRGGWQPPGGSPFPDDVFIIPPQPPLPTSVRPTPVSTVIRFEDLPAVSSASDPAQLTDHLPIPLVGAPPVYPNTFAGRQPEGSVTVGFIVDTLGAVQAVRVISSSQREFEPAALEAVKVWTFRPGKKAGAPVNTNLTATLRFRAPAVVQTSQTTPPATVFASAAPATLPPTERAVPSAGFPHPVLPPGFEIVFELKDLDQTPRASLQVGAVYPGELKTKGIEGWVDVAFTVDSNGLVQNVRALSSSQREFEAAALTAVQKWKFQPGRKGGRDVAVNMAVQIKFSLAGRPPEKTTATPPARPVFAAAAVTVPLDTPKVELLDTPPPQPTALDGPRVYALKELDSPPTPTLQIGAIYPSDLKRRGVPGWVNVSFVVDDKGLPKNVHAEDSSDERFELAAIEAVKKWKFKAGRIAGKSVTTQLNVQIKFTLTGR
jgi:TonB family protein